MKITDIEIEYAIEQILTPRKEIEEKPKVLKKRGRKPTRHEIPVWALEFDDPDRNRSFALISMCIKEDYLQSNTELAMRLALNKSRSPDECLGVIRKLADAGLLGYYDDMTRVFCAWNGGERTNGLEDMCTG